MESFARQLESVEAELATRLLASVPTERLFDMFVKLNHELTAMDAPPTFKERPTELFVDNMVPLVAREA